MRQSLSCPSRSTPEVADAGISELQEKVLGLLEDAGIPTKTNDAVLALIDAAEWEQHRKDLQRQEDAEAKYWSERSPENPPPFD